MSFLLRGNFFYGFITQGIPWQEDVSAFDYYPAKRYTRRHQQRLSQLPQQPLCEVGWCGENLGESDPHFVYVTASISVGSQIQAQAVKTSIIDPLWREQLYAYCELMLIPWQEPSWCLATSIDQNY